MANKLRIKRRVSGSPGAPSSLENAELAFNEVDDILYYGEGTGGAGGTATNILAIAGAVKADINSPAFTGVPTTPTAAPGTSTNQIASTAFVQAAVTGGSVGDGDKGDVTVSGSGAVWTINDGAVSNGKLADMPANTLKGNNTGSSATPADLTVSATKLMLALNNVDNTSDADKPISTATQSALNLKIDLTQKGAINGVAELDSTGKVPSTQLPAIAITETFVVNSQAAMLALAAQVGDVAVRTDLSKSFILTAEPASTLANWQELLTPASPVQSVFGRTGAVVSATGDYTVAQITGAAPLASPTFTGDPKAPTPATSDNDTSIATTAFVKAQGYTTNVGTVTSVAFSGGTTGLAVTGSPITGSGTITLTGTLGVANGGTGGTSQATARTGLGLGTMAVQNANAVAITGGTIDNITLDGGTF